VSGLGVAVVGLGVGEAHARAYLASGCDLRVLYDPDMERAQRLAAELGAGRVAPAYEDLLADPEVAVVSLASPDDAHFGQALAALRAGKHVFVEKPLCRSLDELVALQEARLAHPSLHLGSNLVLRAAPLYRWVREQVAAGALGSVYAFDGDYLYGRLHKITHGWRRDVEAYSVLLGGGIHLVDLMLRITGQRPHSVTAVGNRISTQGTAFQYADYVAATYEFESGLVGRISANFGCVQPHQHVVRVFGTEATVTYDDQGPRLHESRDPSRAPARLDLAALPPDKGVLIPGFIEAILEGADPIPEVEHEFALIAACAAADRALEERRRVDIEYCS
jgi:predicted dehydrogenase